MNYYGIFNKLDNYRLLHYSTADIGTREYEDLVPGSRTETQKIVSVCLPDIEYSLSYIGKCYDPETKTFLKD